MSRLAKDVDRVLVVLVLAILLGSAVPLAAQTPTFGQPTISGIQGVGFEQDIRLDPTNPKRIYTSVPGSLSSDTSWIWHSEDGGRTFKWVTAATTKEGKPTPCAGGGDTELAVDSSGNLYFNDLTLANFSTARSGDHGVSFVCSNTGVPDTAVDRQWYATEGDPTNGGNIYLVNDEIGPGAPNCPVSGAGNNVLVMYRSPIPALGAGAGIIFGPGFKISGVGTCNEGIMGNNEISPVATRTGAPLPGGGYAMLATPVKHIFVVHDDATFSKILIGRCFPVPFTQDPTGLSCVDLPVATLGTIPSGASFPTAKTGANFPAMAIDKKGNLYAVWEQAPTDPANGKITGDTVLKYAYSTNEGNTWSVPITIPTPGLHNNVMAWPSAGDDGRVNIAFYGTSGTANPDDSCGSNQMTCGNAANEQCPGGPDSTTNAIWSLYLVQTVNGHASSPTFTPAIRAGEHPIHKGTIQTVLGHQCGDRTLGDFLQMRTGSTGEAQIAYADSNNRDEVFAPHAMYVKQNGGRGLFAASSPISGDPILLNSATDVSGDGKRETDGLTSANMPNLDILSSRFTQPAASSCHPAGTACYRIQMTVAAFGLTPPSSNKVAVWQTQWLTPASPTCTSSAASCANGGKNPFVYIESDGTSTSCWSGENAALIVGGGLTLTYPGTKQITAPGACSFTPGPGSLGTISIDVPIADVSLDSGVAPFSNRLYSVTASTMGLSAAPETVPPNPGGIGVFRGPVGGVLFDLIDVVRGYDFVPGADGSGGGTGGGTCRTGHGDGDFPGEFSGSASFHFDENKCNGNDVEDVEASDSSAKMSFQSTQILAVAFDDVAHTVTMTGLGTDNGVPVTFTMVAADSALAPPGLFSLALSDGYTNSGSLLDGSVSLQ